MATGWHGPSASNTGCVCYMQYGGHVGNGFYNYSNYAVRPVVFIPRSELDITITGGGALTLSSPHSGGGGA